MTDEDCDDGDAGWGDDPDLHETDPLGLRLFGRKPRASRACAACYADPERGPEPAEVWQTWRDPATRQLLHVCWRCAHARGADGLTFRDAYFLRHGVADPECTRYGVEGNERTGRRRRGVGGGAR